jgi:hypothetical protein
MGALSAQTMPRASGSIRCPAHHLVNSEARTARGRTLLEPVLTGLVRAPLIARQTVKQMMASPRDLLSAQDAPHSSTQRRAPHHSPRPHGSLPPDLGRADPESRQPVAAQGGEDRERSGEGDRLVQDAGEPFRIARAGRSDRQLRLHLDLEGTWPRRRTAMNRDLTSTGLFR